MSQPYNGPPSDSNTPSQDRGLFSQEAQKHESHHYLRMYGGQVVNAAMMGFGMTLGADAANAVVGDAKACKWSGGGIEVDCDHLDNEDACGAVDE
ncbi:hypothetical protein LTR12_005794 [Friedmanniomyces endolithicus]|nr:hypothetical protein LTR74_000829 [Friedmanniomyces endolithicus]KAK1819768.1 hypothetical protein LTR12_005794 [Friedmanniomyces endolithicus]